MKVKFKHSIKTFSGEVEEMVYGSYRKGKLCIGRDYVYPTLNAHNHQMGAACRNLSLVYNRADSLYRDNFKMYSRQTGLKPGFPDHKLVPSGFALFMKMMYAWRDSDPTHVDLATVTIADIVALDAEVRTVARAVDAGFLPTVAGYAAMTGDIQ